MKLFNTPKTSYYGHYLYKRKHTTRVRSLILQKKKNEKKNEKGNKSKLNKINH